MKILLDDYNSFQIYKLKGKLDGKEKEELKILQKNDFFLKT